MGRLPWTPSQLLASVCMGEKLAPLWFDFDGTGKSYFFLAQLFRTAVLYQLIKDSIIAEVKAHLLSWDFADNFDRNLAFAAILEITKFAHTHCISSCPSQASQRGTKCLHGKKLSRLLKSPYFAKRVTLPSGLPFPRDNFATSHVNGSLQFTKKCV